MNMQAMLLGLLMAIFAFPAAAEPEFLNSDDAFAFSVSREQGGDLRLTWKIADGYYLYRNRLAIKELPGGTAIEVELPQGIEKDDPTFGPSQIFHGLIETTIPNTRATQLEVDYQGCKDGSICYPPIAKIVDLEASTISDKPKEKWPAAEEAQSETKTDGTGLSVAADTGASLVQSLLSQGGPGWVIGSFFLFGLLLAFTPCVLPMYPILVGMLAKAGERMSPWRGFGLSTAYVGSMAGAFALLGIVAAWSGENFQIVLQSPYVVGFLAVVFVLLSISMFGVFDLRLPSAWVSWISGAGGGQRGSYASASVLGFSSALVVGPCVTAPLAAGLLYIAQTGDTKLGAASLFALGFGQGIPLIAVGTLGSRVLPRAGGWMMYVKYAFALIFLAVATEMFSRFVPTNILMGAWGAILIALSVFLGAFDAIANDASNRQRAWKAVGLVLALLGVLLAVGGAGAASDPLRPLQFLAKSSSAQPPQEDITFTRAASVGDLRGQVGAAHLEDKPILLYFTADWCVTCKVIERTVLASHDAAEATKNYLRIKVDITNNDDVARLMMREFQVVGPPTMIFFDGKSNEVPGSRLVGEITTEQFIASAAKGASQ